MNKTVLDSVLLQYKLGILSHLLWEVDFHFTENTDYEYWAGRGFWDNRLSIQELNESFNSFVKNNDLSSDNVIYCLTDIIGYFILLKPSLEEKIERLNSLNESNPNIPEFDFWLCSNFNLFERYFKSELDLWTDKIAKSKSITEIDMTNLKGITWITESTNTKGYKTDLAELLFVLAKSKRIYKGKDAITHKDLTILFNELLGTDINPNKPTDLIGKRNLTETFISELNQSLIDHYNKPSKK